MKLKTRLACAALLSSSVIAAPAVMAQSFIDPDTAGPYVAASYGGFKAHGSNFDDKDQMFGLTAGYQFNQYFGAEAGYAHFLKFGDRADGKLKGANLLAVGRLPITQTVGVYGKAGAFVSHFKVTSEGDKKSYDDISPMFGVGADFRMTEQLTAFAEYKRYHISDIKKRHFSSDISKSGPELDTAQVGLKFQF
ncbi:porin family protein [Marinobacter adhaerens]|uniref:Porin family protein n=1 Tax=Marinobacter adhaerens TaxID=1033846 RepID=A0A851HU98_9GAMM|nr:porin family protein [Marinobacter adhaerens]NWN91106.1 porin family protein [Marinobacter adhaerens]